MKTLHAPILLLLAPSLAAAQLDDAQALITTGQPIAGGGLVQSIEDIALSDQGDWCAYVSTDQGGFGTDGAILLNGQVVLREGDTLPSGQVIGVVFGIDLSPDGSTAWTHRTDPGSSAEEERLYVDGVEVLSTGGPISGPGIPSGSTLRWLRAVRYDAPYALVSAAVSVNGFAEIDGMLLVDLSVPGAPTLRLLALEGNQPALLPGPILGFGQSFDVASDGTYIIQVNYDDAGTTRRLLLTDQGPRALDGTPAPLAGAVWNHSSVVYTGCAAGGRYVYSTRIDDAQGTELGIVVGPSGLLALEGAPLAARPGVNVESFSGRFVGISSGGAPAFVVPIPTFSDVLVHRGEVVLEEGVSTVSGIPTGSTLTVGFADRIAVGPGGRELLTVCTLANGATALAFVEPIVGTNDPLCVTTPNSTGATGTLRGLGSTVTSANQLVLASENLPPFQFGLLVVSRLPNFLPGAGGSAGNLCLGGLIGRFNLQIAAADASGQISTPIDLTAIPRPNTVVAVQPGETWRFQRWHRDVVGGSQTSNYTESLAITFR